MLDVQNVSIGSPFLRRGSLVCRLPNNTVTLAGAEGTGPDSVFGIVLDYAMDANAGLAVSVARSGVYDATQLIVDPSVSLEQFEDQLRIKGIFLQRSNGGNHSSA